MVDSHAMENGCIQIVDVHWVFSDVVAEIVGLSVGYPTFDSPTGHPHAEVSWVMIPSVVVSGQSTLAIDRASEFPTPYDQCVLEHAATLQILNQRGDRLIDLLALVSNLSREITMLIPTSMEQLHDPNSSLDESSCQQRTVSELTRIAHCRSVHFERLGGFCFDIG